MNNTEFIVKTIKTLGAMRSTLQSTLENVDRQYMDLWKYLPYIKVEYFTEDSNTAYESSVSSPRINFRKWVCGEAEKILQTYINKAMMMLKHDPQLHHVEIWLNVAPENKNKELHDIEEPDVYVTREGAKSIIKY